ncbi:MAG: hypothetical protein RLZZ09_1953 [Pseudomonadota bacterium]|jgi:hypothetical protein
MKHPPRLMAVRIAGPMILDIDWSTGETLTLDLSGWVTPPFDALSDPDFFARPERDDWGHGIAWPGGLDLGADLLYEKCREQAGMPTAKAFDEWMTRNGLSLATAAETLGMTRRMIAHYRSGSRPIPKIVGLACTGWELERTAKSGRPE